MVGVNSDSEPLNTEVPAIARRRRKKSQVWEHFTIEAMSGGCTRARCNLCEQTFAYSSGTKVAGTSHLKRHITLGSCPMIKSLGKKHLALTSPSSPTPDGSPVAEPPAKRRYRGFSWANALFEQDSSCLSLTKMIIKHEYPLHMVEHPGFISFVQSLQARFKMPSSGDVEAEILSLYQREKQSLLQVLATIPGRISLSIGVWTTSQTLGYVGLVGQFIDGDWKLQRRLLSFLMISSSHSENALSEAIGVCLTDWNIAARLFTITMDNNYSSHDIYSENLRDHLASRSSFMVKGQIFVVRCYAHILNVIAHDLIASIHGIIYNIRESVKFVKASPACEEKFAEIALQLEVSSTRSLSLDVSSQWGSTYLMLVAALEYREAFNCLETCDDSYNEAPSGEDWKKLEVVCAFLKLLYDSSNAIMGTSDRTGNLFFHEAWKIQMDLTNATRSEDELVSGVAREMYEKFDKYWKDCSLVLAVAVVMDPRFKMKLVEFSFNKIYGDEAARYVKVVSECLNELYLDYEAQPLPLTPAYVEQTGAGDCGGGGALSTPTLSVGDELLDFDIYISEMRALNHNCKSELEQYLEESLTPRVQEFNILNWWKLNMMKYPTLSKMARDILAIPMFMATPGVSFFGPGNGSRVLDEYRSSLRPEIVEALFCAKDWLQNGPPQEIAGAALSNAVVKLEC